MSADLEFYETPQPYTEWLFERLHIRTNVCEPCVGDGAILRASRLPSWTWVTNDLDPARPADFHRDARDRDLWRDMDEALRIDWTVSNTAFTPALEIAERAIETSRIGVALHLRASMHEVLKTGIRRTWMRDHRPTGILWLPRFAYQRSKTTGQWTTDSVCPCWCVWIKGATEQFIDYAPEWVIDGLDAITPAYRERMDALMGYQGSELERREARKRAA